MLIQQTDLQASTLQVSLQGHFCKYTGLSSNLNI